jgi:hypothetical protein
MTDPCAAGNADQLYAAAIAAQGAGRYADGARLLHQASAAGHVPAMSLLGAQLISGRGTAPDLPLGVGLIMRAADLGGAYACGVAAAILASDAMGWTDWNRALDYLQRSAELGSQTARQQLRLLAGASGPPVRDAGAWGRLRRKIDLERWRAAPQGRALSNDPRIVAIEGFVSAQVCDWIVSRSRDRLEPAKIFDTGALRPAQSYTRSNSAAPFDLVNMDLIVQLVRERLAAAAGGLSIKGFEAAQVFHYAVGEQFAHHYDFLERDVAGHAQSLADRGQRVATLLVYLNADYQGGETDFPRLDLRFRGAKGDALIFWNVDAAGEPDRRTYHAGLAPTAGEKWLLSQWARGVGPGRGP